MKSKLITIEGIDGSGKGTQAKMLVDKLNLLGIEAKLYSFPAYDKTFFGKEVGAFLRGEFGGIDEVHPKLASMLYAFDRLERKEELLNDLKQGVWVVCDRYVESNMAHQASKLNQSEREAFYEWLDELEYEVNKLPRPDITIFLDVPLHVSKKLVLKKAERNYTDSKEDIHEKAYGYLEKVYTTYSELKTIKNWKSINCVENSEIKSMNSILTDIINEVMYKEDV